MTPEETAPVDDRPSRVGVAAALSAGLVAALAAGGFTPVGLALGVGGLLLVAAGLLGRRRWAVTAGTAALVGAAVAAGAVGAPVLPTLVGAGAAVVAGDAADRALDLSRQLGAAADTRRLEVVRTAGTAAVTGGAVAVTYLLYRAGTGGQPVSALVLLVVAAALLALGLD